MIVPEWIRRLMVILGGLLACAGVTMGFLAYFVIYDSGGHYRDGLGRALTLAPFWYRWAISQLWAGWLWHAADWAIAIVIFGSSGVLIEKGGKKNQDP
jgi:hypothetical protein